MHVLDEMERYLLMREERRLIKTTEMSKLSPRSRLDRNEAK